MFYNSKTAIKGVISNNNWGNEQGSKVTVSGNDSSWADYKIVVDGTNLAVFRNNALIIFKANTGIKMSDLGATTATSASRSTPSMSTGMGAMDDIKVYRGADLTMPTAVAISGTGVVNNKLTLIEKDSTKLTALRHSEDDAVSKGVTWSSSDGSVAKVAADGTVTGVKAGTATITATTELGGVKAELPVTVEPMNAQNAAAADLDAAIAALKVPAAENLPLVAKGTDGSAITWKSSDEKLITSTNEKYSRPLVPMTRIVVLASSIVRPTATVIQRLR